MWIPLCSRGSSAISSAAAGCAWDAATRYPGRATSGLVPTLALANEVDAGLLSRDPSVAAAYAADPLVHEAGGLLNALYRETASLAPSSASNGV